MYVHVHVHVQNRVFAFKSYISTQRKLDYKAKLMRARRLDEQKIVCAFPERSSLSRITASSPPPPLLAPSAVVSAIHHTYTPVVGLGYSFNRFANWTRDLIWFVHSCSTSIWSNSISPFASGQIKPLRKIALADMSGTGDEIVAQPDFFCEVNRRDNIGFRGLFLNISFLTVSESMRIPISHIPLVFASKKVCRCRRARRRMR